MPVLQPDDIVTPRLTLIALTPEMLLSERACDHRLGDLIRCTIPPNWPLTDWEPHVFDFILTQLEEHPEQLGWHRYVGLAGPGCGRTLIGSLGAFSKKTSPAECEIGYSILPPFEGRGFATEAATALIEHLGRYAHLTSIIAHTFPTIPASIRVMEKCGLLFDGHGEEAGTVRYRLNLRSPCAEATRRN